MNPLKPDCMFPLSVFKYKQAFKGVVSKLVAIISDCLRSVKTFILMSRVTKLFETIPYFLRSRDGNYLKSVLYSVILVLARFQQ